MAGKKRLLIMAGLYFIILLFVVTYFTCNLVDKIAVTSFKKLYSAYTQALYTTVYQMDGDTGCYFSSDKRIKSDFSRCDSFYKKFATNLRVNKYCKTKALADGCIPIYENYAKTAPCAGFSESMMNKFNQAFVMNDNTNIIVFNLPANVQKPLFAVDSNGKLFPNRAGYDLFSMVIMRNKYGNYYFHPNVTYCLPVDKDGIKDIRDVYK